MQYGINEEANAIHTYSQLINVPVTASGLWVNKHYVHLGASPDGLIMDSNDVVFGIVEVKCLKALRIQTVEEWIKSGIPSYACVSVIGGKLSLKKNHSYYYQIQTQLLITQASYCDFVLHSKVDKPHVERVFPDIELQIKIIENTGKFWYRVLVPEYFLMRVPRELLPSIF